MMMGDRQKSYTSLYKNIENYSNVFGDFFYLHSFPIAFIVLIGVSHWHTPFFLDPSLAMPDIEIVGVSDRQ